MNEFEERGTSVIKRSAQEMGPDNENRNIRKISIIGGNEEYVNLHCSEKIANESSGVNNIHNIDHTRGYYYHHNSSEDLKPPVSKEDYESDNERRSRDLQKTQDQRAVPQFLCFLKDNKLFVNQHHSNPSSPSSNVEEVKQSDCSSIKNERDSPVPPSLDDSDKKAQIARHKGRPKPLPGSKPEIKCEQCGKIFGSSSALAKHKLTHSDERRYVCPICSKGFKRQDHLNGHMVTHRDKKPYECSFQDCDKSYCDMRSLRRHLENHHANGHGGNEGESRTSSPALTVTESSGSNSTPIGESSRVGIKPGRGRPPKDRSLKLEGHEVADCESGKSSGTSTPGSTHEVVRDQAIIVSSRERNSDSFSSTGSEDVAHVPLDKPTDVKQVSTAEDDSKSHTAIDLLKQAAERAQEHRDKQNVERFPQQQYVVYPDGTIPYPQWYQQASMFAGQDPRFNVYQYPQIFAQQVYHHGAQMIVNNPNMPRHAMAARIYTEGDVDQAKQQAVTGPKQITQRSPSVEYPPIRQPVQQTAGTPTDPTAIALATAKDRGQQLFTREGYYGIHPSGTQWQQVRYDETSNQYNNTETSVPAMGNVKTSFSHVRSPSSNSSTSSDVDGDDHYHRGMQYAPGIRHEGYDTLSSRKPGHTMDLNYPKKDNSFHHVPEGNSTSDDHKAPSDSTGRDDGVFRNPGEIVTPRRKQRPKPEPLKIPASVSTAFHTSHPVPGSPPYTPPPMLSPRSFYSHVNAAGNLTPRSTQLPMTPSRLLLSSRSRNSIDVEEEAVVFPEPKINVGPQFQAKIPDRVLPKEFSRNDIHRATICWNPMDERKKGRTQEIEAFLEMSTSCAIVGGSSNKEYALHILQRAKGNIKEAVKLIISKKYVTVASDPMYDYHYEGSVKWSARERQTFRNAFRTKNKDFTDLQKEIGTKTVADCVEFYYLWKANNPEAVRGRTRYVDSDSEEDYEYDTGSETNSNPSLFECDFPQCSAKFVSRQALNGHIRVHGGSFMKPSEPRKRRNPATTTNQDGEPVVVVKRPRKPYVPAPMPQPLVEGGPLPEYACKVCGRIFHKIKSRSAHMKTHVKRPDDDHKHNMQH
ncbi:hypothetical protein QZH41_020650 [Actinostola sp. cb2023]|nr:hypothetical protein QZH41_020650 [Actinostola sp. cb2023]